MTALFESGQSMTALSAVHVDAQDKELERAPLNSSDDEEQQHLSIDDFLEQELTNAPLLRALSPLCRSRAGLDYTSID